jgi:hypothetical protein
LRLDEEANQAQFESASLDLYTSRYRARIRVDQLLASPKFDFG